MTKFATLPSSIEFQANAQTMVGNNSGSCLLHLTGAAITIKFPLTGDSASWPYNCIRQFRADEDTRQFSFFSGRRGPYGVAEYKFDMTERMLLEMQDALTQFTGAQFGQNPTPGTGSGNGFAPESVRSPKRDPLPQVPGTPPTNQETHAGYTTHQANFQQKQTTANIFGTLPPRYRQESLSSRPPVPAPYDSHTMGSRGRQGSPSINTKYSYHEVTGGFPPGAERGVGFSGSTVPGPIISGRKMSHGDEVFSSKTMSPVRNGKLMRQATAPTHRLKRNFEENESPTQSGVFSPPPAVEPADGEISSLDFGGLLRRSSPQVDRKNTTRRGRTSPPDSSSRHDMYNVPRPTDSTHSPPPPASDALYQVPRSDPLSQESAEVPTSFAVSPTQKDNVYSVPKPLGNGVAGDLYSAPRPHRQQSREETPTTPDTGGSVIYNVPSSRPAPPQQQQQLQQQSHVQTVRPTPENGHELYNTPRAVVAHDPYNSPQPVGNAPVGTPPAPPSASQTPQSGHELYNVPRAVGGNTQDEDNGLYNVPRSVDAQTELYNVPKPAARQGSYDSLQSVQNSAEYQASKPGGNPTTAGPPHHRKPIPTPEQETYSVPRSANPPSSPVGSRRGENNGRRYPYDYVDHRLQKGTLKSSQSLESLVRHRVSLSPDAPSQPSARAQRTPSPRALQHKYIEIDIDEFTDSNSSSSPSARGRTRQQMHTRPENMYAEISDTESTHSRGSHPGNTSTLPAQAHSYQHTNGAAKPANNTTPLPLQQGRMYLSQSTNAGLDGVSKEARALHEDGYELVLPADDAARNLAMKQQKQATLPMTINRAQSVSAYPHRVTNGVHPVIGEDTNTSVLGTSIPHSHRPTTDEYVIVNRREFNTPTQPRDIPVPLPQTSHGGASSHALNVGSSSGIIVEDEYEIMSSVKKVDTTRPPQFSMASSVPSKKWGSVSTSNGSPGIGSMSRGSQQSARDSLDLESVETGSRASVGSGGHLDELVGPLSPIDAGALQIRHSGPARPNVVRIASGSPHDLSSSKELKFRSNAVENILDGDEKNQKYENVTDEDIATKHALSVSHHLQLGEESAAHVGSGAHRKPPMPLPRTARPEH